MPPDLVTGASEECLLIQVLEKIGRSLGRIQSLAHSIVVTTGHRSDVGRQRWWHGALWGAFMEDPEASGSPLATTPIESPVTFDSHAKLVQLIELHAQGALTDEEFAEAKRRVLGLPASSPGV